MSEEIDIKGEIERLQEQEPFVPFTVVMASGDRYEVTDPQSIVLGRNVMTVVPPRKIGHSTLRLNQISSIDAVEPD